MYDPDATELHALLARQDRERTLESPFYTSPSIFWHEVGTILARKWLFVDHISRVKRPGDYVVYDIANESVIITMDETRRMRAFANVCRHRGTRICTQAEGHARTLVCRYHGWQYALDGRCLKAHGVPDGKSPSKSSKD